MSRQDSPLGQEQKMFNQDNFLEQENAQPVLEQEVLQKGADPFNSNDSDPQIGGIRLPILPIDLAEQKMQTAVCYKCKKCEPQIDEDGTPWEICSACWELWKDYQSIAKKIVVKGEHRIRIFRKPCRTCGIRECGDDGEAELSCCMVCWKKANLCKHCGLRPSFEDDYNCITSDLCHVCYGNRHQIKKERLQKQAEAAPKCNAKTLGNACTRSREYDATSKTYKMFCKTCETRLPFGKCYQCGVAVRYRDNDGKLARQCKGCAAKAAKAKVAK